jgi:hypothetical protein
VSCDQSAVLSTKVNGNSRASEVERVFLNALAKVTAALPSESLRLQRLLSSHRSEPVWHFQEKSIHLERCFVGRDLTRVRNFQNFFLD